VVLFANGLGARKDFARWNAVISVVPWAKGSSCIN